MEISQYKFPLHWEWKADGKTHQARGLTLTHIGELPGGLEHLDRFVRWSEDKANLAHVRRQVASVLERPEVAQALDEAKEEARIKGKVRKGVTMSADQRERNLLFGL